MKKFRWELLFFAIFVVARLPYLGHEMFNTDVWKWKQRIYDFGSGVFNLDFEKTLQKYHPGVTLMWIGTGAIKAQGLYCSVVACPDEAVDPVGAIFTLHFFQKLAIVLVLGVTFCFIFYPLRKLFGVRYAFITLSLLTFEPFFYALTRVIHLEGLMTAFMLASFVWLFYDLEMRRQQGSKTKPWGLIVSGIFAGLSALTKSSALFMLPFAGLTYLLFYPKNLKQIAKMFVQWFLVVLATYFVLWPSMWVQPLETLDYVFIRGVKEIGVEGGHEQIFLGRLTDNPGVLYYFVVAGYKFSPLLVTGILLFGLFCKKIFGHFDGSKTRRFTLLAIIFTFGYLLEITLPTKKLDRYILPAMSSLALLAGFFYSWLLQTIGERLNGGKLCALLGAGPGPARAGRPTPQMAQKLAPIILFVVFVAYQSLSLTPDYFSYYSPLFGGLQKGVYALEPKWIIGQHQVTKYVVKLMHQRNLEPFQQGQSLNNQKDLSKKLIIAFPEKYYTQIWPFIRQTGAWATIEDLTGDAKRSNYFVYPVWDDYSGKETRFKLVYQNSIYLRGVKLYNVYQRHD